MLAIFLFLFSMHSCAESEIAELEVLPPLSSENSLQAPLNVSVPSCEIDEAVLADIEHSQGMLKFADMEHFQDVLTCLELQLEYHQSVFEETYAYLSDDAFNDMADSIGFRDWKPLEDFEATMNFSSRRGFIENQILEWLDDEIFDTENAPDDLDDLSEELRTLLSVDGKVMVGDSIFDYLSLPEEEDLMRGASLDCRRYNRKVHWEYYPLTGAQDKAFKLKAMFVSYPWKFKVKSKIVSFKRNNGKYRRWRTKLSVQVFGHARDSDCNFPLQVGASSSTKRRISRKAKHVFWDSPDWPRFKKYEVGGYGVAGEQYDYIITLGW